MGLNYTASFFVVFLCLGVWSPSVKSNIKKSKTVSSADQRTFQHDFRQLLSSRLRHTMAQAIRGFMDRSQCRSLVDKATTSDEQATPGYLYNELASNCYIPLTRTHATPPLSSLSFFPSL